MVIFFKSSAIEPPITLYMGKDKVENEELIRYAWPEDVWFHVDKLSSAHVYLRMTKDMSWDKIPVAAVTDCAQLVKANSIEGNKKNDITVIYTPAANLKKTGDMAVGQVSFHNEQKVKRVHVEKRENPIVNRLNKTKLEKEVNHELEKAERERAASAVRKVEAIKQKKAADELAKQREADKMARSYDLLFTDDAAASEVGNATSSGKSVRELEEDFM